MTSTILLSILLFIPFCVCQTDDDVTFFLFTKQAKDYEILKNGHSTVLMTSSYDGNNPTRIVVHGWRDDTVKGVWMKELKDAFLNMAEDVNIILVDWGKLANNWRYSQPVKHTSFVGKAIARLVEFLESETGTSRKNMHFIGHSLGGQIVGFAGQNLTPRPARVTGLDTAEIGFNQYDPKGYLDPTDADFVDEISGIVSTIDKGHANFYPNGGRDSHWDPPRYFTASVRGGRCSYPAYTCDSYKAFKDGCRRSDGNHMGYYAVKPQKTITYYLDANMNKPC